MQCRAGRRLSLYAACAVHAPEKCKRFLQEFDEPGPAKRLLPAPKKKYIKIIVRVLSPEGAGDGWWGRGAGAGLCLLRGPSRDAQRVVGLSAWQEEVARRERKVITISLEDVFRVRPRPPAPPLCAILYA